MTLSPIDRAKDNAARAAVALVEDGMRLGLGTGSTAEFMLKSLGERVAAGLRVTGVATSERTARRAAELGIAVVTLEETPALDLAIDGADEFDPDFNLIKGAGGALLREKIVASAANRFIVIADASKRVARLGAFPLPVEIVAMAAVPLATRLTALGATVTLRTTAAGKAFVTDEGHYIVDCAFGEIADPPALAQRLSGFAGIVEHGLFCGMADTVFVGGADGVERLDR
jgi:ribose 5-phosphate isomerase A